MKWDEFTVFRREVYAGLGSHLPVAGGFGTPVWEVNQISFYPLHRTGKPVTASTSVQNCSIYSYTAIVSALEVYNIQGTNRYTGDHLSPVSGMFGRPARKKEIDPLV